MKYLTIYFTDASYYAVAVVKKGAFPGLSMKQISGYKTCHTGVGKSSGWNVPMGWLLRHNGNPSTFEFLMYKTVATMINKTYQKQLF